jgi:queuine/archaeosine tRNA-ribosyltransferase
MGELTYSCAGADPKSLPAPIIESLLFNVLDHGANDTKIAAAQEMCRAAKPSHTMLDSSGYQILKGQEKGKLITFDPGKPMKNTAKFLNISSQHVMQVAAIHQPEIVIGLDFPIQKVKSTVQEELEFAKKRPFNVQWAHESIAWRNALVSHIPYFQPIQCFTLDHLDVFLKDIRGVHFDGVSMPVRNLKLNALALFMVSFFQRGIRKVHLLGTCNFLHIAMCAFMARNMFDWVSLDSTSWRLAADKMEFFRSGDLGRRKLKTGIHIAVEDINDCLCPYCRGRSFLALQALEPRKTKVDLLRRHNWWALKSVVDDLRANSADLNLLEAALKARASKHAKVKELIEILSLLDLFKDVDIGTLMTLLPPISKKRTRSRASRSPTRASSRPRKSTITSRKSTSTVRI